MSPSRQPLSLVYSCSGCSSAAQLANHVALRLDRAGTAEMSCVAGVGGNVPKLVKLARSGRPILALDDCYLACVRNSLAQRGVKPDVHLVLTEFGVKKRYHAGFDPGQAEEILAEAQSALEELAGHFAQSTGQKKL